jgi:1,4-alpha-glucan branching enzyme
MAKIEKKQETFAYFQPSASTVAVAGDFTEWEKKPIQLRRQKDGTWKTTVPLEPGTHQYRFLVDGEWRNDSQCTVFAPNPFGAENCVRIVK